VIAVPVVGIAAIAAPFVRIPWSVLPVLGLTGVIALVVWLLRRRFGESMRSRPVQPWTILGLGIAAAIISAQVAFAIESPVNFSNTFDNVFHLNVIRFILDTGNASSLWVGHLTDHSGTAAFYPAVWHDLVSLVAQMSGVSSLIAVNATTLVISALIWPAGVILLTRQLFGSNRVVLLSAGILAAAFPVFPLLMMDYGVLYPYQLGVALIPATVAATLSAVRIGTRPSLLTWQRWVLLVGMLPGVFLAHPGAFVAWMAFTVPVAVLLAVRGFRTAKGWGGRFAVAAGTVVYLLVGYVLLMLLRPSSGRDWPIESRVRYAVAEVFTGSVWYGVPAVLAIALVLVGILWTVVRRRPVALVAVGMLAIAAILYVVVTALPYPHLRDLLTGSWYNNRPRLAALLPVLAVPVGAYGAGATWVWLRSRARRRSVKSPFSPRAARWTIGVAAVVIASIVTQLPVISPVPTAVARAGEAYRTSPTARLVTSDELELLNRLDDEVPPGAVIVGSPWTGTALAYAIADRSVVLPHMFTTTTEAENEVLNTLNTATPGSATCDAVAETGVQYVLDFGTQEIHGAANVFPGLTDLDESPALELVDEQGQAKLFRVVGC
jgi:hypothetical protein